MAEPAHNIANRVAFMRDVAEGFQDQGEYFVFVRIPESLGPFDRGNKYEDPLIKAFANTSLGRVNGGGQQLGEGNSIVYCGVDIVLTDRARGLKFLQQALRELGAPAGTVIEEFLPEFQEHPLKEMDG